VGTGAGVPRLEMGVSRFETVIPDLPDGVLAELLDGVRVAMRKSAEKRSSFIKLNNTGLDHEEIN